MGACASGDYPADIGNAELLIACIKSSGGSVTMSALGIAVILACLTTAIGQVAAVSDHFSGLSKGKFSYDILIIGVTIVSALVSLLGLDNLIALAAPTFGLVYPVTLAILLLGVLAKVIPNDGGYKGAALLVFIYALIETFLAYGVSWAPLTAIVAIMPLSGYGFGWIPPFIVGVIGGSLIYPHLPCAKKAAEKAA